MNTSEKDALREAMVKSYKQVLPDLLSDNVVEVTFTKVSTGETRIMPCTLDPKILPQSDEPSRVDKNPDVARVWVTDIQAWRSFRYDSVTNYKVL